MLPFTLKQLRILKAVAMEKNFTKAARLIYLSQPSLSKQLKILEKNLDVLLFERDKNKIILTEQGQLFLLYAERILALCEESYRALADLKYYERGNLKIGTNYTIETYLLTMLMVFFAQKYPQIKLNIQISSTKLIAKKIVYKTIDVAIINDKIPDRLKNNILIENFVDDELHLIISKYHPFAFKNEIEQAELYNLNFIVLNSASTIQKFIDHTLYQNQIKPNFFKTIMELNSIESIKTAVSLGLGVAFVSSSAIKKELELQTLKVLPIKHLRITRTLSLISNSKNYKSKIFKSFYTELLKLRNQINN